MAVLGRGRGGEPVLKQPIRLANAGQRRWVSAKETILRPVMCLHIWSGCALGGLGRKQKVKIERRWGALAGCLVA